MPSDYHSGTGSGFQHPQLEAKAEEEQQQRLLVLVPVPLTFSLLLPSLHHQLPTHQHPHWLAPHHHHLIEKAKILE